MYNLLTFYEGDKKIDYDRETAIRALTFVAKFEIKFKKFFKKHDIEISFDLFAGNDTDVHLEDCNKYFETIVVFPKDITQKAQINITSYDVYDPQNRKREEDLTLDFNWNEIPEQISEFMEKAVNYGKS